MNEFIVEDCQLVPGLKAILDLGEVNETARVILNGEEIGSLWKKPYKQ